MALPWHLPNICACVWTLTCLDVQDLTWRGQNKLLCVCCTLWTGRSVCLSFHTCVSVCIHALWCVCVCICMCACTPACLGNSTHTTRGQGSLLGSPAWHRALLGRGRGQGGGAGFQARLLACVPACHACARACNDKTPCLAGLPVCVPDCPCMHVCTRTPRLARACP